MRTLSNCCKLLNLNAEGGTRTRTGVAAQRILSPLCLPFHHPGKMFTELHLPTFRHSGLSRL
jgi:hypothetical protein